LTLQTAVVREVGPRENNEDSVWVSPRLVAVADGVGGAIAGEIASGLAIRKMSALSSRRIEHPLELELSAAVEDANAVIEFVIDWDPRLAGMGTTLTAVALSNDGDYLIANVGDSRTYLQRDGQLRRLTRDDSMVQVLLCSDGVTDYVSDDEVARTLMMEDADAAVRQLARLALERGGRDNITAVIADVVPCSDPRDGWLDYLPYK
jgi:protein phosphatase